MWYKEILVSEREKCVIDALLINLKTISINNYVRENWSILYFHSQPFMEEPIYHKFIKLLSSKEFAPINIFCYPFTRRTTFLRIEEAPDSYSEFNQLMEKTNLLYTGGFGYCQNRKLAFVSAADTEVFSIGYDPGSFPEEIKFDDVPQFITKTKAKEITKAHLDFLNSASNV